MYRRTLCAWAIASAVGIFGWQLRPAWAQPPNLLLILTDNQGAWTLGCYGNRDIRTPNIDRLAGQGMRFTRCYSSNAVCSPTRATLLTGLLPSQHGVHCYLRAGGWQIGPAARSTIEEFRTLPEILASAGYTCGLAGKWHLGNNLRPQEGFSYWITKPHGHTTEFYDVPVIEDGRIRNEPQYTTELWTQHAVRFIEQNRSRPFFLLLAYNGPYGLGGSLLNPARNRHAQYYADKTLPCFPRVEPHPWLFNNRQFINNPAAMRRYAAEISGVDDGVGAVLEALDRLDLADNTLVVFTADQGLSGGQNDVWGMGDHTRPLHAFDSTMHVPLVVRHPGRIRAGSECHLLVSNYDLYPTVLSYLGLAGQIPERPAPPGRDFSPALRGERIDWENVVFYEFENCRAIRTDRWKLILRRFPADVCELYDLGSDPGERNNLFGRPEHAAVQTELADRLETFFDRYADPQYDLWHGGGSKSHLLTRPKAAPLMPEPARKPEQ